MPIELTTLIVDDQDRAIRFFVDVLGFDLVEDSPAQTGAGEAKRWIVVRSSRGGGGLVLAAADGDRQAAAVGDQFAGRVGLFLRVDDFDATYERLVEAGVEIVGAPRDEPYGRVVVFTDIAGNRWDLLGPRPDGGGAAAPVVVRRERPADRAAVRAVQAGAFDAGNGEAVEARLLDALRHDGWIPALSWVAELDGQVVGHVVSTRATVGGVDCVGLGPIGVLSAVRRTGIGSALMWASIGAADALGEPLIGLLGSPDYYRRFGFVASTEAGVEAPDSHWGPYFQVRVLSAWDRSMTGRFRYAAPFDAL